MSSASNQSRWKHHQVVRSINLEDEMSINLEDDEMPIESSVPKVPRKKRKSSTVWDEFTPQPEIQKTKCDLCGVLLSYKGSTSGTSSMKNHLKICQGKIMGTIQRFDMKAIREAILRFVIESEQSFRVVEKQSFIDMFHAVDTRIVVPSRSTIKCDLMQLHEMEKIKLKKVFLELGSRVSLTTDTWTSVQNMSYMCVTAHYIDDNWDMQKKCIAFRTISSHTSISIGQILGEVLRDWGIDRIGCVTVDNASQNSPSIDYIKHTFSSRQLLLDGDYMHLRCACHVINLIVKDGLKPSKPIFKKVRRAVRFVRSSPARLNTFKDVCDIERTTFDEALWSDTKTRWNSTYFMLEKASRYKVPLSRMGSFDKLFPGSPSEEEWVIVDRYITFLRTFLDATKKLSVVKSPGIHLYVEQMFIIQKSITEAAKHNSGILSEATTDMQAKLKKYWVNESYFHLFPFVAMILDPRYKMKGPEMTLKSLCAANGYLDTHAKFLLEQTRKLLKRLYKIYAEEGNIGVSGSTHTQANSSQGQDSSAEDNIFFSEINKECNSTPQPTELSDYLKSSRSKTKDLNILEFWKSNESIYPILARIARDIFAIPVSTVASESTFSTSGRIISEYRSRLAPETVEALICVQSWISGVSSLTIADVFDDLDVDD